MPTEIQADPIETTDSAQIVDANGFITIENQPISREGVFKYLGKSIGAPDPDRVYNVYRPADELKKEATLNSFKLVPFIHEHVMVGDPEKGYMPAEKKGVHGTTGDRVDFRDGVLYSNLKIFSESLARLIKSGKKDLSIGYKARYEFIPGTFAGQHYDAIQRDLTGNHLALVDKGRSFVSVLDSELQITYDSIDFSIKPEDQKMLTPEEIQKKFAAMDSAIATQDAAIKGLTEENKKLRIALDEAEAEKKDDDKDDKKVEDEDDKDDDKKEKTEDEGEDDDKKDKKDDEKKTMDAMDSELKGLRSEVAEMKKGGMKAVLKEVSARDALAKKLSYAVGTFDHSEMTTDEVAQYGVKKLGLTVKAGQEHAALDGYLAARQANPSARATMDSAHAAPAKAVNDYFKTK